MPCSEGMYVSVRCLSWKRLLRRSPESGSLADQLHVHRSRSEGLPGCPRVTVRVRGRPPDRAREGYAVLKVRLSLCLNL